MELLEAQTLKHLIMGKPLEIEKFLDLVFRLADALDAIHSMSIVHRDIKASEPLRTQRGPHYAGLAAGQGT